MVSITIVFAVIPLTTEICRAAKHINCQPGDDCSCCDEEATEEEDDEESSSIEDITAVVGVHDNEVSSHTDSHHINSMLEEEEDVHNVLLGGPIEGQLEDSISTRVSSGASGRVRTNGKPGVHYV